MVTEVGQQAAMKLQIAGGGAATPRRSDAADSAGTTDPMAASLPPNGKNVPPTVAADTAGSEAAKLKELVSNLNAMVQSVHRELKFSVDDDTGQTVIRVINSDTEEVIRQIPPDEILAIARNFTGSEGLLLNAKV